MPPSTLRAPSVAARVSTTRVIVAGSSRSRRVAVCGSSRWWATIAPSSATSGSANPSRRAICWVTDSPTTEWSPPRPLPMSCSRAPDQQQVRARHPGGEPGGEGRGLDQVPVDGPDVGAVAGRQVAHRAPLGEQPPPQAGAVERLDDVDERAPGAQERQQLVQRRPRPGFAQLGSRVGEVVQRARRHRQSGPGRGRGHAQHQRRVAGGRGVASQRHLPEVLDDPRGERAAHRWAAQCGQAPAGQRGPGRAQAHLGGERDRARGARTAPGPGRTGRRSPAPTPPRRRPGRAARRGGARRGGAARCGRRAAGRAPPGRHAPGRSSSWAAASASIRCTSRSPPWPFFRSGSTRWAISPTFVQRSRAASASSSNRPRIPARQACRTAPRTVSDSAGVAGDVPGLQQPQRGAQVRRRDLHGLPGGAHGVVEPDPGVPQRVPHLLGEPLDVLAAVVQQHEVEVRVRRELAPAQGADRDQRRRGPRGRSPARARRARSRAGRPAPRAAPPG